MGRYAKTGITEDDLKAEIEAEGGLSEILYNDKLKVYKDLLKVDMGCDRYGLLSETKFFSAKCIPSYETITKDGKSYPIAWCYCNAEGEQAVAFVLYVGHEGKLRAFIPNKGNNFDSKKEAKPLADLGWRSSDPNGERWFNYSEMKKSVIDRIDVK